MLHKTEGICLHYIKYKDHSIIARIFTKNFGLQSYLINSVRTAKPKFNIALFQPLSLLEMVVYHKEGKETLQRVAEIRLIYNFQQIPFVFAKSALAMVISEVLGKVLYGEVGNEEIFQFLKQKIIHLDQNADYSNFLITFLLELLQYLGFWNGNIEEIFQSLYQTSYLKITPKHFEQEIQLLQMLWNKGSFSLSSAQRSELIDHLLNYYRIHFEHFGKLKSLEVFRHL
ncbi:DNA repair protein RecO [Raineya orbicola]|jgi:DNA repair protein RecO (recombination protein O)|uniref:Reco: DNA repair protein RecO n=1 Tax=Raineya orbicola TaxID=2016530 RepID=A0A2N3IIH6_9BACT|nr:DNA repair protein RecO [Raineya orbicola]PKQ70033.1 reco: DNA repair protein RecO [Raineya orbicola]